MVTKFREMKNAAAPVSTDAKKGQIVQRAREVLCDNAMNKNDRHEKAFSMLTREIEKRGGKLVEEGPENARRMICTLNIPAGKASITRAVKIEDNGQIKIMQVKYPNSLDEKIVEAANGFGMGALDVSFKVRGEECFYCIRTNGSRACLEENKVNVALALVGAASIVEEIVEAKRSKEAKDTPKLVELKKVA